MLCTPEDGKTASILMKHIMAVQDGMNNIRIVMNKNSEGNNIDFFLASNGQEIWCLDREYDSTAFIRETLISFR